MNLKTTLLKIVDYVFQFIDYVLYIYSPKLELEEPFEIIKINEYYCIKNKDSDINFSNLEKTNKIKTVIVEFIDEKEQTIVKDVTGIIKKYSGPKDDFWSGKPRVFIFDPIVKGKINKMVFILHDTVKEFNRNEEIYF